MITRLCARCSGPAGNLSHCRVCIALIRAEAHARGDAEVLEALTHAENLARYLDYAKRDEHELAGRCKRLEAELAACRKRAADEWSQMANQIAELRAQLSDARRDALQLAVSAAIAPTSTMPAFQPGAQSKETTP